MNQEQHELNAIGVKVKNEPQTHLSDEELEPLGEQDQHKAQVAPSCTPLRTRPAGLLARLLPDRSGTIEVVPPPASPTTRFSRWRVALTRRKDMDTQTVGLLSWRPRKLRAIMGVARLAFAPTRRLLGARAQAAGLLSWRPKRLSAIIGVGQFAAKHMTRLGSWLSIQRRTASLLSWRPGWLRAILAVPALAARHMMTGLSRWLGIRRRIAGLLSWGPRSIGAIFGVPAVARRPVIRLSRWLGVQQVGVGITIEGAWLSVARHWQLAWSGYAAACVAMFALGWHLGFGR